MIRSVSFLPLLILPVIVLVYRSDFYNWSFMLFFGYSIFLGCRWLTFWKVVQKGRRPPIFLSVGYLFLWIGMDAETFLSSNSEVKKPNTREWLGAVFKTLLFGILLWGVLPLVSSNKSLFAGWVGIFLFLFFLFSGVFHVISLLWRHFGLEARHILNSPLYATSLSGFWGRRWNLAFHDLARRFVFKPVFRETRKFRLALFSVFLVSGVAHELITSLPAGKGYGLPTAFFVAQFLGISLEKSAFGKRNGLKSGTKGRLLVFLIAVCPFFLLFHPPFVNEVGIPFLAAIGAF